mmetsp:Transcript_56494/g.167781  ORF Transcript_56494/g.167781 Transcript_56494/m.167781 type:complete len:229 (+) Transcript_56494:2475-3161(+)
MRLRYLCPRPTPGRQKWRTSFSLPVVQTVHAEVIARAVTIRSLIAPRSAAGPPGELPQSAPLPSRRPRFAPLPSPTPGANLPLPTAHGEVPAQPRPSLLQAPACDGAPAHRALCRHLQHKAQRFVWQRPASTSSRRCPNASFAKRSDQRTTPRVGCLGTSRLQPSSSLRSSITTRSAFSRQSHPAVRDASSRRNWRRTPSRRNWRRTPMIRPPPRTSCCSFRHALGSA